MPKPSTPIALVSLLMLAAVVGGAAGYSLRGTGGDRPVVAALATQSAELQALREALPHAAAGKTAVREDVVALVQAAASARAEAAAAPAPSAVLAAVPAPTSAASAAVEGARHLVDDAVADGRWTDARATSLRALLRGADGRARDEALRYLSMAANRNALILETSGPPL